MGSEEQVPDDEEGFSEAAKQRKAAQLLEREREFVHSKDPLLVLRTVVEAEHYGLPLPPWALRGQAEINQAILRVGEERHRFRDLPLAICRAIGLARSKRDRRNAFAKAERATELLFLAYLAEAIRARKTGHLPTWSDAHFVLSVR